jgi:hypothetical protein
MYMMLFTFVYHDLQKLILSYKNSDMHAAGFSLIIDVFSASKLFPFLFQESKDPKEIYLQCITPLR